jgi:hypothetical protein
MSSVGWYKFLARTVYSWTRSYCFLSMNIQRKGKGFMLVFEVKGDVLAMELFRMSRRVIVREKTEPFKVTKNKILAVGRIRLLFSALCGCTAVVSSTATFPSAFSGRHFLLLNLNSEESQCMSTQGYFKIVYAALCTRSFPVERTLKSPCCHSVTKCVSPYSHLRFN